MINGKVDEKEKLNKSMCFITTAGYRNTFSYEKLIQTLCQMVARPDEAIVLGGSWRVPVMEGLLAKDFVRQLRLDGEPSVSAVKKPFRVSAGSALAA